MAKSDDTVEVRVLRDCVYGLWGEVVRLPRSIVAQAKRAGHVEDDPAEVEYAKAVIAEREQQQQASNA